MLRQFNLLPPALPLYIAPNASADRVTVRRAVVNSVYDAYGRAEYAQVAMLNATLSQEAFQHAWLALDAWKGLRDPATGLLPYAASPWYNIWSPDAAGGNLYAHLVIASFYLAPADRAGWEKTVFTERALCGGLTCEIEIRSKAVTKPDPDYAIKSAAEYSRDGLVSIVERFGRQEPWYSRSIELTDGVMDLARVPSRAGPILSNGTEINGSWMQVLCRLYWITRDERYLQMAERIADTYLFEVIPANRGLTANYWDFKNAKPLPEDPRFRPAAEYNSGVFVFSLMDHGSEIVMGLSELYLLEKVLDRPQAIRYRQPLQDFLDQVLQTGRTEEGLWMRSVDLTTGKPFNNQVLDTWGYLLAAFHTFDLAEGTSRYSSQIAEMMRTVATKRSLDWEYGPQADGYADSLESMLYLLPWFDIPEARQWVDDEIEVLFLKQRASGFVEGWYLDGNFVRTSLLYGFWKTQGLWSDPWSPRVRVGAALDRDKDLLYIHIAGEEEWRGVLHFDLPRHQTIWNMPIESPRVNGLPEWYVVEPTRIYRVTDLSTSITTSYTGLDLAQGLPIVLGKSPQNTVRLVVSRQ
ncbi:MAG: hypothetical protein HY868_09735 [Chloroflexi bacterium]|nr:hypothetical protein [Chloroflexota bacterium]